MLEMNAPEIMLLTLFNAVVCLALPRILSLKSFRKFS